MRVPRDWGETPMLVQASRHLQALDEIYAKLSGPLESGTARAAGADLWAGIDYYRGYHHQAVLWLAARPLPALPKFDYYLFQSQRPADPKASYAGSGPMIFIANCASFQSPTTVTVFSNCEQGPPHAEWERSRHAEARRRLPPAASAVHLPTGAVQ